MNSRRLQLPRAGVAHLSVAWILPILGVFFLGWQAVLLQPAAGLDDSWSAGLSMAVHMGIGFGNHLVFTYGPLGFLGTSQLWYAGTGVLAFLYLIVVRGALAGLVYLAARHSYGAIGGFLIAVLVISTIESNVAIALLIAAVWVLQHPPGARTSTVLMACGGALAALELLVKVSVGGDLAVMVAVLALTMAGSWRRHVLAAAVGFVLVLLLGWVASGQSLGALPDYVHNSARIVSGYSSAMVLEESAIRWQYPVALIAFLFGLGGALYATSETPSRQRVGAVALWVVFAFFEFKEAFQRHDVGHGAIYFGAVLGGFLAYRIRPGARFLGLGLLGALLAFAVAAQNQTLGYVVDPFGNTETAVAQLEQVFDAGERNRTIAAGRAEIFSFLPLEPETLALVRGRTVAVAPYESALVWAYRLRWKPLPVFQSYSAYTSGLDQLDADTVASSQAPERILLSAGAGVDGRIAQFDEPLTERTILCRYRELWVGPWDVLGRGPNRCGRPVAVAVVKAAWGQQVAVPAPPNEHTLVIVHIAGVQVGGLERLRAFFYKARERFVSIDGVSHRLVAGTAGDGLVLRAPAGVDFSPPFAVAPNAPSIAVTLQGSQPGGDPITYTFEDVPVTAGPRYGVAVSPPMGPRYRRRRRNA
jgi:uncharacterized membrane protein